MCCWVYHMKMGKLRVGFNFMRNQSSVHIVGSCTYHCKEVCGDGCGCQRWMQMFPGTTSMQESLLYPINKGTIGDVSTNTINVE